jgi:hypothetical protein
MNAATETRSFRALFAHLLTTVDGLTDGAVMEICAAIIARKQNAEAILDVTISLTADDGRQVYCALTQDHYGARARSVVFFVNRYGRLLGDCTHVGSEMPESMEDILAAIKSLSFED